MYPFGYGLSYTTFDWSDYNTSWDGDTCTVTVKVTNTGSVAGKDVVEVYAQSPTPIMTRPTRWKRLRLNWSVTPRPRSWLPAQAKR